MLNEADLIKGCKSFSRIAQKELYLRYSAKMCAVCLRYTANNEEAQDVSQEGFIKVFSNIDKYSGTGSLEGWIRRIMVNTAIAHYHKTRKNKTDILYDEEISIAEETQGNENDDEDEGFNIIRNADLSREELISALEILSDAYRIVFNMYYLENYSHKEIAEMLKIDEKTSRTRLFRGRKQLQKYLYDFCTEKVKINTR